MNEQFHALNDAYRSLLSRTSPSKMSSHELASSMFTCVCELTLDASDGYHSQHQDQSRDLLTSSKYSPNPNGTELACLVLSLVEKISSKLTSQQLSQETSLYFKDVSTVLFQHMDFMSKLVHLACCKDRLLSHLAAKSVSSYVIFELRCFNTVNQIWEWKCLQVLQNPCSGNELDACTWSLTTVLKAVLKETSEYKPGTVEKLLATFDTALTAAYSQLVPVESLGHGNSASYPSSNTADWATTLTNLLDLLEVLTAARFKLSTTSVCFTSSRLSLVQASALLRIVDSHVHYFVKKQVLLLLKRILLQKAGEDMGFGEASSLTHGDDHMTSDILTLADDVLQAVHTDWLQCVPVESAAIFFGGTGQSCGGSSDAFDHVMLRAVSLVVLKSLEYKIQSAGGKGVCNTIGIHGYLSALLLFLRQRGVQLKQGSHSCCWVSLVFGEQDDDMMEAAKALLLLYLHHRMIDTLYEWIWWDRFWLPVNLTWADLEDRDGRVYAKASDLYVTLPYAIGFLLVRYLFERLIATPLAASVGIREKARLRVPDNPILELYYLSHSRNPGQAVIDGLSKKSGWCVRQVERWFRKRRNQDRPGVLKKFREASWRFVFYLLALIGGVVSLYDTMLDSQYWYYILEMSFYGSLLFRVTFDVKRKDFKEQIIHHLATLTLLSFSWCVNYIRIGTLVMLIHDASDVLLESAKLFNYAKWERTCNSLFVVFAIVFMVTRLIIFPFWLIHCTWVYPTLQYPPFFGYYFFNVMLVVLLFLHIFWAYLILRMVKKFLFGKMTRDERSDDEEDGDESSLTEEEKEEDSYRYGNGSGLGTKEGNNGCFRHLSLSENVCPSKTVY
ncbi:uncharacterized protein cers3a isoform X2 [Oncorhynchus nerka]|uniref:uncharacterized protein cers3a isoform X2 n=1 Tax=Oncorhynchus nerka TaxID=8023 RepID=UPI0031B81115